MPKRSVLAVIEVPTDDLVLVRMGLFLDGVVKYERAIGLFHLSHHGLDLLPEGPGVVDILGQEAGYPAWLTSPSSMSDRPVAVAAPKELSR